MLSAICAIKINLRFYKSQQLQSLRAGATNNFKSIAAGTDRPQGWLASFEETSKAFQPQLLPAGVRDRFGFIDRFIDNVKFKDVNKGSSAIASRSQAMFDRYKSSENKGETLDKFRTEYNQKAKNFRAALKEEKLELAAQIGQDLLEYGEVIRGAYDKIIGSLDKSDPARKKVQGYKNYTNQVDKEILQGQPKFRGRHKTGIIKEFDRHLKGQGKNVIDGFTIPIKNSLAKINQLGQKIGLNLAQGTSKALEIKSPSRVFQRIGLFIVAGFKQGIAGIDAVIKNTVSKVKSVLPAKSITPQQKLQAKTSLAAEYQKVKAVEAKINANPKLDFQQKLAAKAKLYQKIQKIKERSRRLDRIPVKDKQAELLLRKKLQLARQFIRLKQQAQKVDNNPNLSDKQKLASKAVISLKQYNLQQQGRAIADGLKRGIIPQLNNIKKTGGLIGTYPDRRHEQSPRNQIAIGGIQAGRLIHRSRFQTGGRQAR